MDEEVDAESSRLPKQCKSQNLRQKLRGRRAAETAGCIPDVVQRKGAKAAKEGAKGLLIDAAALEIEYAVMPGGDPQTSAARLP